MITIRQLRKIFNKLEPLDLELIIADAVGKSREFVLAHPEYKIPSFKIKNLKLKIARRRRGEPLAYILGHKEFFGLDFLVNKNVLIPRPETELLVEQVLNRVKNPSDIFIDVGTGSGNIIVSLAKNNKQKTASDKIKKYYAIDISKKSLEIAKRNAKRNKIYKKIKFIQSDLLKYFFDHRSLITGNCFVIANLPYLSEKIFSEAMDDVKKFEPRKALLSSDDGLGHYIRLLQELKKIKSKNKNLHFELFFEISPEQKKKLDEISKDIFPGLKTNFLKDLAGKWRIFETKI